MNLSSLPKMWQTLALNFAWLLFHFRKWKRGNYLYIAVRWSLTFAKFFRLAHFFIFHRGKDLGALLRLPWGYRSILWSTQYRAHPNSWIWKLAKLCTQMKNLGRAQRLSIAAWNLWGLLYYIASSKNTLPWLFFKICLRSLDWARLIELSHFHWSTF